jgi:hypothetical protein
MRTANRRTARQINNIIQNRNHRNRRDIDRLRTAAASCETVNPRRRIGRPHGRRVIPPTMLHPAPRINPRGYDIPGE